MRQDRVRILQVRPFSGSTKPYCAWSLRLGIGPWDSFRTKDGLITFVPFAISLATVHTALSR